MSDWEFLNKHRMGFAPIGSVSASNFNGFFRFAIQGEARRIFCIASDGFGWQHVSVSFGPSNFSVPPYRVLCAVKDLFWESEDWVVHFFPAQSAHINNHPGCLHLWRCIDPNKQQPIPETWMVGFKPLNEHETCHGKNPTVVYDRNIMAEWVGAKNQKEH